MASPDVTAGDIMDASAALLNDVNKEVYTYTAQLPYLKIALKEFREVLQQSNIPVTNAVSSVLTVPANTSSIAFSATTPLLPSDLAEIQQLWESQQLAGPFVPMTRKEFLPHYLDGQQINQFLIWTWESNAIKVQSANAIVYLKIDYIKQLFNTITDQTTNLGVINSESWLNYKNAHLCARYIGEDQARANDMLLQVQLAEARLLGIENKAKQGISTRRRPFRGGYKSRGI